MLPKDDAKRLEGLLENMFEDDEDFIIIKKPYPPVDILAACCTYNYTDYGG